MRYSVYFHIDNAALDLVKNEQVAAIIGPQTSAEAQFIANLGEKSRVPIISYSLTSHFLSPLQNPYFIRATQDESTQVQPISALMQAFGWREVVPIFVADEYSGGIIPLLAEVLLEVGIRVPYKSVIPSAATDDRIEAELYRLKSMSTRVFLVHMEASIGSRLFLKAKEINMLDEDYVWIVTNTMANVLESLDLPVIQSMQGVLGMKTYVPKTKELENFTDRWQRKFQQENPAVLNARMNVHGLWAYDATIALARAVEEVGVTNFTFQSANNAASLSTDISDIRVSRFGSQLLQAILRLKFVSLSGNFVLVDGQLKSSTFKLINVVGNGGEDIGYWMSSSGFVKEPASANNSVNNTSNIVLKSIRWPGNSKSVPKGWVVSPNGKKLRIGVPIKNGFLQFVKVTQDPNTNITEVTGYCIDIFDAVMSKLPYLVHYEYIPFGEHGGQPSYDTLVNQVYQKVMQNMHIVLRHNMKETSTLISFQIGLVGLFSYKIK